jgi:hypothetical protein
MYSIIFCTCNTDWDILSKICVAGIFHNLLFVYPIPVIILYAVHKVPLNKLWFITVR